MNTLPIRRYEGPVHLVAAPGDFANAMRDLSRERVVGFDTETRPTFHSGESYRPSLVQLATAEAVYLFQVQQHDCAAVLQTIFASESLVKAGVSVADDLGKLKQLFELDHRAVVDLGRIAKRHGLKQTGVRNLAAIFLGNRIPKGAKTSNWAARRLTAEQIRYAATDAWVCRELYLRFEQLSFV